MNKQIYCCCLFLYLVLLVQGQNSSLNISDKTERTTVSKARYHIYDPPFLAKPIMKSVHEAKNRYPEEFMISKISEDNWTWVGHNTLGLVSSKTPYYFQQKANWDPDRTYYELTSKLEFVYNGWECAYVRFRLHGDGVVDPPVGVYFLRKKKGRWHYDSENISMNLSMAIALIRPEILGEVLEGQKNTNPLLKDFIEKVSTGSGVDLLKLGFEILNLREQEETYETKSFNQYFFESLNW